MADQRPTARGLFEFVAIVLGVVLALAADEWRQGLQDRASEQGYLERLEADLTAGLEQIQGHRDRFVAAGKSAEELIHLLEQDAAGTSPDRLLELAVLASRTGFSRSALTYRTTYDELLMTRGLGLIRSETLRRVLIEHFRGADALLEEVEELPQAFNARFKRLTGVRAVSVIGGPESLGTIPQANLLRTLRTEPAVLEELRYFSAELAGGLYFDRSTQSLEELLAEVRTARLNRKQHG